MPTNLFGPGDNYHPQNSHVVPVLIRRFHQAKVTQAQSVILWGTGKPRREFLYVDEMAAASLVVMSPFADTYARETEPQRCHLNLGHGSDVTILELAQHVATTVGYNGQIELDRTKPDGAPRKLMDSSRLNALGWQLQTDLTQGLKQADVDFLEHHA
jgi:GDP-L-fucose synthase